MRLIEVKELPRRAKGAPVVHIVKVSPRMLREKEKANRLIRDRLEELSPKRLKMKANGSSWFFYLYASESHPCVIDMSK